MLPQAEPAPTVVVCEDDAPTLDLLCDHLEADRFHALPAPSAADALRLCHYKQPDLLLLDLRLPDAPGLDVLREIRASEGAIGRYDPALPVIVLSGRGTQTDRVRGFAEGADDYLVKPLHMPELTARIRAVLRRRDPRRDGPRRVGELFIDPSRRQVRVGDRPIQLANKEFSLLRALAADPRRVLTLVSFGYARRPARHRLLAGQRRGRSSQARPVGEPGRAARRDRRMVRPARDRDRL